MQRAITTTVALGLVELPVVSPTMEPTVNSLWPAAWRWHLRHCHCSRHQTGRRRRGMRGTRPRRRRQQFLRRDLDQDCWKPWPVSNRPKNAKSELPFLRPLGTVESFLLEWQTCLVCSPQECSGVKDFDKAKRLDPHTLCWKWCWNVTDFGKRSFGCAITSPRVAGNPQPRVSARARIIDRFADGSAADA